MTRKSKTIAMLLVALGLIVAATSAALGPHPNPWFGSDRSAAAAAGPVASPAAAQANRPADSPMPPPAAGNSSR
jgi:hypothetical protein